MADKTIDQLTELTALDAGDLLVAYDVSELGDEKIRKITKTNAFAGIDVGDVTTAQLITTSGVLQSQIGTAGTIAKNGSFAKNMADAPGNTSYTGIGFKPRFLFIKYLVNGTAQGGDVWMTPSLSNGFYQGSNELLYENNGVDIWVSGQRLYGTLVSFDSDGFTLNWAKTGSPTGTAFIFYTALGPFSESANAVPIDWANPINITTTPTTLTIGKHHIITETTADRTHTLPAVSGNSGRQISIQIAASTTKLITIDGNASETIDGALTRIMWAGEAATLLCNGTTWSKIAGKSIPMQGAIRMSTNQTFNANVATTLTFDTQWMLNAPSNFIVPASNRIVALRPNLYHCEAMCHMNATNGTACNVYAILFKNTTEFAVGAARSSGFYHCWKFTPFCNYIL